ncbi:MAG: lactate utilization protein [Deltaproteobacteria bacterium]|nr:lactate utilization protein [Deltaproteobacteria bacterium]
MEERRGVAEERGGGVEERRSEKTRELVRLFKSRAREAGAVVVEPGKLDGALAYALDLVLAREAAGVFAEAKEGGDPSSLVFLDLKPEDEPERRREMFASKGIRVAEEGLRKCAGGIDLAFTGCALGIAESGSVLIETRTEDLRLATMLADLHAVRLPKSLLARDLSALPPRLRRELFHSGSFVSLVTGPSRTADVERVLTLGVHGPLELHVLLTEE